MKNAIFGCLQLFIKKKFNYIVEKLIDSGIIEILIDILEKEESHHILEIIELFIIYEKNNPNLAILNILQSLGMKKIELLVQSHNKLTQLKATSILNYLRDLEI